MKPTSLHIVFRSCAGVHALSGRRRLDNLEKPEITQRCFRSLLRSIRSLEPSLGTVRLEVVDDSSPNAVRTAMRGDCARYGVECTCHDLEVGGNSASLRSALTLAREPGFDAVYLVEDDYLHFADALTHLLQARTDLQATTHDGHVVMHPYDCPDRYIRDSYPTMLRFAAARYWRLVRHTTGTLLIDRQTLLDYWKHFEAFSRYGTDPAICEDNTINRIYSDVPCYAPIPTLAIHLQYAETIPLFLPAGGWRDLWEGHSD